MILIFSFFKLQPSANSVSSSVFINNASPSVLEDHINTISSKSFSDASIIYPSPGGTRDVYINGYASDPNGKGDIVSVRAAFFQTSIGGCTTSGRSNNNSCYYVPYCQISGTNTDNQIIFSCAIPIWYYANGTLNNSDNWTARVEVTDASNASSGFTSDVEIGDLLSISTEPTMDFGTLSAGESTTANNNTSMVVTQTGNIIADISVSGSDMTCTKGTIPRGNIFYTLTDSAGGTPLTSTLQTLGVFNLPVRTDDAHESTKDLYWNITIPSNVSGTCTGSIAVVASADR